MKEKLLEKKCKDDAAELLPQCRQGPCGGGPFCDHLSGPQQYFRLNCQQKFNLWAAGRRIFPSSSTLLNVRYVPSPYRATTVTQLWATGGKY
jgi:hypothetical protein